ncbi:protein-glutamate O-methyltransferase CheR [bacterium]|nr:protein-glutamate O-methyltransferase CheR [bacterium]
MGPVYSPPEQPAAERISDRDFQAIRKLVYDRFGINLTDQKKTLVVGRLQKVLRQRGFATFAEYYEWVTTDQSGEGLDELANRISTNHTFFYREKAHFEFFVNTLLPGAVKRHEATGDKSLRIWCAGCSSGEEPYTLMMLMMEFFGRSFSQWQPRLLATDISATALRTAMAGEYDQDRVSQLPAGLRNKYFAKTPEGLLRVTDDVRRNIVYRRHNLMDDRFPFKNPFDAVFCRNVMIYFDRETRNNLVGKYFQHTAPGGFLFIGHSETLARGETPWDYVMPAVYVKRT